MFAKNLKYLREKHNMEQIELAEKLSRKSSSSISEWEKGKYTPKLKVLNEISKIFKIDIDDLMNVDLSSNEYTQSIESLFNQLDDDRKKVVLEFIRFQLNDQNKQ